MRFDTESMNFKSELPPQFHHHFIVVETLRKFYGGLTLEEVTFPGTEMSSVVVWYVSSTYHIYRSTYAYSPVHMGTFNRYSLSISPVI